MLIHRSGTAWLYPASARHSEKSRSDPVKAEQNRDHSENVE